MSREAFTQRLRAAALFALLVATLGTAPSSAGSPEQRDPDPLAAISRAVAEARESLELGETQVAESRYRTALFEGWMVLGLLAQGAGDLERAREAFETAATTAVEVRRARLALAAVLVRLGEIAEAELVLRGLIAEDTGDSEARRLLARALAEGGDVVASVQELEQLHHLTPGNLENAYLLATAYLEQGRLEAAGELLGELAEGIPTPQTQILIGRTYRDSELYEAARRAFETALAMDPGVRRAHYYLGTVHLLERGTTGLEDAVRELGRELEASPGDEMTSLYLGMALVELHRFEEAIPHLELAARREEVRVDALRFLGRALLESGRVEESIAVSRRGLESAGGGSGEEPGELTEFRAGQLSSLHYQLAQALRSVGDRDSAGRHFAEAKRYQARSAESARESLDRYLAAETATAEPAGPPSSAAAAPQDREERLALERSVESTLAGTYLDLGVLEVRSGDHDRAARLLGRAAELDPDLPEVQRSWGVALFNAARFREAAAVLSRALEEKPDDPALREMLALARLNADEYRLAAELLAELPQRRTRPGLEYAFGLALVRSGRAAEAEEVFRRLLRENADWPELNVVLGQAFAQQGDFAAAAETLRRALALDPAAARAHATLAEIHLRRGELEEAEAELREELAHHPGDTRAAFTLATVLELRREPEEAEALLRSLLEEEPQMADGRYLLGKILLARGEAEEAREQLEAAAGLEPEEPNIRYQLGQAYQKLGRRDEARREFETFRELKSAGRTGGTR